MQNPEFEVAYAQSAMQRRGEKHLPAVQLSRCCVVSVLILRISIGDARVLADLHHVFTQLHFSGQMAMIKCRIC